MANEHLRTAASNIQRAVQDVHDAQKRIHGEVENVKRENNKKIDVISKRIAKLNQSIFNSRITPADKVAIASEQRTLQAQISNIKNDNDKYINQRNQEITMFENQANEFEGLARHLNTIA